MVDRLLLLWMEGIGSRVHLNLNIDSSIERRLHSFCNTIFFLFELLYSDLDGWLVRGFKQLFTNNDPEPQSSFSVSNVVKITDQIKQLQHVRILWFPKQFAFKSS